MKNLLGLMILLVIGGLLFLVVYEMPPFGEEGNPAINELSQHYIEHTVEETGVLNGVTAIITDYRAFDTLGEVTVLLTAIASIMAILKS